MDKRDWSDLIPRVERVLGRIESWLDQTLSEEPADSDAWAFRWQRRRLEAVPHPDLFPLETLIGVERSLERLRSNVSAFVRGEPALDTLLYGDRGTGKSSAVRGVLGELGAAGLRLVEIRPHDLATLPQLLARVRHRYGRFLLFCDDLAFEEGDPAYRELKSALDGGVESRPGNALIVATSNRRHLVPERTWENLLAADSLSDELHPEETREDKMALAERFGLLIPFFGFDQETYLRIVDHYAEALEIADRIPRQELHARALRFALERSSRSGRTARQACVLLSHEIRASLS
jgi:predicted AAA+ superfamily ATPase